MVKIFSLILTTYLSVFCEEITVSEFCKKIYKAFPHKDGHKFDKGVNTKTSALKNLVKTRAASQYFVVNIKYTMTWSQSQDTFLSNDGHF